MRRILLLVLGVIELFANPLEDLTPSTSEEIASLKTDFAVGGYVNPFSGQLTLKTEDLHILGSQDLILSRIYLPPKIEGKYDDKEAYDKFELASALSSSKGWLTLPHLWCGINARSTYFQVPDPNGFVLQFVQKNGKWVLATPSYGMSNFSGEEPNSSADVRNTKLECDEKMATITAPNGTKRMYEKLGPGLFRLQKEILPNGKALFFEYDNHQLAKIISGDASGRFIYGFIKTSGAGKFLGSDGTEAKYSYEKKKIKGSKKNQSIEFSQILLSNSSNPFYSNSIEYNDRHLLHYYDAKEYPIRCEYTNEKGSIAQVKKLFLPIGSYSFSYDTPIAEKKGGSTTVIHPNHTKTIYRYDHRLLLISIENWERTLINQKTFQYDQNQYIAKVETKDGNGNVLISKTYTCDESGNPIVETWEGDFGIFSIKRRFSQNRLVYEEQDDGLIFEYSYFNDTNLVTAKTTLDHGIPIRKVAYTYDDACNLIEERVEGRTITKYTLRKEIPNLHRIEWKEERDWDGALTGKIRFSYDSYGRISKEEVYGSDDKFAFAVEKTYNEKGELLTETNPLGQTASYAYDARGRVIREVPFSRKIVIRRDYDKKGRLTLLKEGDHATQFEYDDSDLLTLKTDYLGFTTRYTYDSIHRKPKEIDAPPQLTHFVYDCFGREIERSDGYDNTQFTQYNAYGSPLEIIHPSGEKEQFQYNPNGTLKTHIDPDGFSTTYAYDALGRVITKVQAGAKTLYRYDAYHLIQTVDAEGIVTDYTYDKLGRKVRETVAGQETILAYDPLGFVAMVQKGSRVTKYSRDVLGRVLEESVADLLKTSWAYDEDGNIAHINRGGETSFVYDDYNRLIQKNDPLGFQTTISYLEGEKKLVKRIKDPRGVETVETYNSHNLLLKREIPGVQLQEFEYDRNLRRVRFDHLTFSYTPEGLLASVCEAGRRTTRYTYTPGGRTLSKELPDGQFLRYEYDNHGFISKIGDLEFNHDSLGRLIGGTHFKRSLDPFGNVVREEFTNGLWIESQYDEWNQPTLRIFPDGSGVRYIYDTVFLKRVERIDVAGNIVYTHSYNEYDLAGNLLEETHRNTVRYHYDKANRQTLRLGDYLTESCRYDGSGNVLEKGTKSYFYDALSQITAESPNGFQAHYDGQYNRTKWNSDTIAINELNELEKETYDLNGNLIREGFEYDAHGRLIRANGQTIVYDALGRRISKGDQIFLYIGEQEIASFHNGQAKEVLIPGLQRAISIEIDSVPYIPIYDVQNTIRLLVEWRTGDIVEQNHSDVFGNGVNSKIPYACFGKRFDLDTGLFYFGKRYYDPNIGRWLTPDPLWAINSSNLYQFLFNNPFAYTDPDGQFAIAIPLLVWGASLAIPAIAPLAVPILCGAAIGAAAYGTYKLFQNRSGSFESSNTYPDYVYPYSSPQSARKNTDVYVPDRPLPNTVDGVHIPDTDAPHTQLGAQEGRKGKYPQAREFDEKGNPVRDIDFTDHGRPKNHPNPHQHEHIPNPTGGTPSRDPIGKPVTGWDYL